MAKKVTKPKTLSASSSSLWTAIVGDFEFCESELAILQAGLEARDRYLEAKGLIDRDGITIQDRFGTKIIHPAFRVESRMRDSFLSSMRMLKLNASGLQ